MSKIYYFGDATQNRLGSYASIEGFPDPYIVYKPGFRGYITPQFSPHPTDWYSQLVFSTKLTQIQNVSVIDIENPENSFFVNKSGVRTFTLSDSHNNIINNYDTLLLINMLSEFKDRYYEMFLPKIEKSQKDSIIQSNPFKIISVTDVNNKTTTVHFYYMIDEGDLYEDNELIEEDFIEISKDRAFATINDNKDEIYTMQLYTFARQLQPLSYFLKK
jgi:hypothetical protein